MFPVAGKSKKCRFQDYMISPDYFASIDMFRQRIGITMKFIEQKRTHIPAKVDFIHQKYLNIPYAQGGERNMLDIYLPNDGAPPFPTSSTFLAAGFSATRVHTN